MFDFFRKEGTPLPTDIKGIRESLLRGIKTILQGWEGGEGANLRHIELHLAPKQEDSELYNAAVWRETEGKFAQEVQRVADDFAIELPAGWVLHIADNEALPEGGKKIEGVEAALRLRSKVQRKVEARTAYLHVMLGKAEEEVYTLQPKPGALNIGRDKKVQTEDGFFRINHLSFPTEADTVNASVSRQHAHVEWSGEDGSYLFYADTGGLPPRNKIKIKSASKGPLEKMQSSAVPHRLEEGDQIQLGDGVALLFTYLEG